MYFFLILSWISQALNFEQIKWGHCNFFPGKFVKFSPQKKIFFPQERTHFSPWISLEEQMEFVIPPESREQERTGVSDESVGSFLSFLGFEDPP